MSNEATNDKATTETAPPSCAPSTCSARPVAVSEDLIRKIVERAKASPFGLNEPEASLYLGPYGEHTEDRHRLAVRENSKHILALVLVSAWTEKYDLVSIFAAAMSVIEEEAQNDRTEP